MSKAAAKLAKLQVAKQTITDILVEQIEPLFKPGMKFTVIARDPTDEERELIISNDDLAQVEAAVRRATGRPST